MTVVITLVSSRLIEPRLGVYAREPQAVAVGGAGGETSSGAGGAPAVDVPAEDEVDVAAEARGLRYAGFAVLGRARRRPDPARSPPGAPLRNPVTGSLVEDAPLMTASSSSSR